jgi:hypothetical protein
MFLGLSDLHPDPVVRSTDPRTLIRVRIRHRSPTLDVHIQQEELRIELLLYY